MRSHDDNYQRSSYIIPEEIRQFLLYMQEAVANQDVFEIQRAYESGFNSLTEAFFKSNPWPEAEDVAQVVGEGTCYFFSAYVYL